MYMTVFEGGFASHVVYVTGTVEVYTGYT